MRINFIGVIKTATKMFYQKFLNEYFLPTRGDSRTLVSLKPDGKLCAHATVWVDQSRRFFIGNAEAVVSDEPTYRVRWQQPHSEMGDQDALPERLEFEVQMPKMVESYYDACGAIDKHNKQRQDDLEIERKMRTKVWWKRVNTSIFGMIVVDAMNVHQACVESRRIDEDSNKWISGLAHELINNRVDHVSTRSQTTPTRKRKRATENSPILTPCKKKDKKGYTVQGRCRVCKDKCTDTCRLCTKDSKRPHFMCNSRKGKEFFEEHLNRAHG
jgi:hypothetical protein